MIQNPDALPQLIGEFAPVDEWQSRINRLFYGLRGDAVRRYFQTFSSADFRLAHALAADYFERVTKREKGAKSGKGETAQADPSEDSSRESRLSRESRSPLVVHEWGPGNGNLAGCFLTHLKQLDKDGQVYPRVHYVLVGNHQFQLDAALRHPALAPHRERVSTECADVQNLAGIPDGAVDRILCADLWNELPTKLMVRKEGEIEEEYLRPNLKEQVFDLITDWAGFVRAFEALDVEALKTFPPFLEEIVWEREYRKTDWKSVSFRKTITDHLKQIEEHVLVPVNLGAYACLKEAKRLLAPDAIGLSAFDAGSADLAVLNDPEKPCYGLFGGQYSFMVNVVLAEAVASYVGFKSIAVETQREFVGQALGINVMSVMDLLAGFPSPKTLSPWEQDRLVLQTVQCLNQVYTGPYGRPLDFSLREDTPPTERKVLEEILKGLKPNGIPDTVAYLSEDEIMGTMSNLTSLGYDREAIVAMLQAPPQPVDYYHMSCAPGGVMG
jgi:hypothetical protein